jgi:hypothetical protein
MVARSGDPRFDAVMNISVHPETVPLARRRGLRAVGAWIQKSGAS